MTLQRKTADIRQLPEPYLQKALHRKKNLHSINSSYSRPNDSSRYGEGKNRPYFGDISARPVPVTFYGLASELTQVRCFAGQEIRSMAHGFSENRDSLRPPKGVPPACLWNPAGRQMESRRPPNGIPLAAICNPVGRHMQSRRPPSASRHE